MSLGLSVATIPPSPQIATMWSGFDKRVFLIAWEIELPFYLSAPISPHFPRAHKTTTVKNQVMNVNHDVHQTHCPSTALRSMPELASPFVKISFLFKGFLLLFPIRDPVEFSWR
jgi:hypothetical protein